MFERIAAIGSTDEDRAKNMLIAALAANNAGDSLRAAEAFHQAWSGGLLNRDDTLTAVHLEARLRLSLTSQEQTVIDILAPRIEGDQEAYIAAVEPSAIDDTGKKFSEVTIGLAFAYAALDRWTEAVAALERARVCAFDIRRRCAARLGATLLALEEQLHAPAPASSPHRAEER